VAAGDRIKVNQGSHSPKGHNPAKWGWEMTTLITTSPAKVGVGIGFLMKLTWLA
jgi:hypothetical protein